MNVPTSSEAMTWCLLLLPHGAKEILRTSTEWMVVEPYPSETYKFVNWVDDIPNIWENQQYSKPPTRTEWMASKPLFKKEIHINRSDFGMFSRARTPATGSGGRILSAWAIHIDSGGVYDRCFSRFGATSVSRSHFG